MVYFVGAGTGAADLITVRGMRLLEQADVVIYAGSLVNPALLDCTKESCQIYNSARLTLEEVLGIMRAAEADGKATVRLHTGDPSIYGAVREQMDELDKAGISYESCPGVSACFGAAAALNLEYTLPGVSQSLIITRMEGKTKVPASESIEGFAAHRASMAVYLSAGRIQELSRRLLEGGYQKDTPAAIVYKATWPEEEVYLCTVETLFAVSAAHGITKTALVLVGDVLAHPRYEKSRLYAADFSTEFRKKRIRPVYEGLEALSMISFTENGSRLSVSIAKKLEEALGRNAEVSLYTKCASCKNSYAHPNVSYIETSISAWAKSQMQQKKPMLFIGACGIAVRAIAPSLTDKLQDAPVLVMDESGRYVVPILSGHMGGANGLAQSLARMTGAKPVVTTATDIRGKFAVDIFAKKNGLFIADKEGIVKLSSKALAGKEITVAIETGHAMGQPCGQTGPGSLPEGVRIVPYPPTEPVDVVVTSKEDVFAATVRLRPREYIIGIGCKKGKKACEIEDFISRNINKLGILPSQIYAAASISLKRGEPGITEWCRKAGIPFITYTATELQEVNGIFLESSFVKEQVGVGNVCERAAVKACGPGGMLVAAKSAENGMTLAVAKREWEAGFYGT